MTDDVHTLTWMPFQAQVINDNEHREILLSGAYGSAKTRTLCGRAMMKAQYKGARVCLTRKTQTSLLSTTVRTLLEPDGELPPVLPEGSYVYKEQKGRIFIHGGGEIVLCGCDNHLRLGSEQFSDVMVDEGIETDEAEWIMLLGRMRVQYTMPDGTPNRRSITCATNPGSPAHYLYKRFYVDRRPDRLCIESNTSENYYLPEDYKDSLNDLHGVFRQRYYLGQWVAFEGAIFPDFNEQIHLRHYPGPWDYYVAGVDVGMNHPSVIRVHGCKDDWVGSHVLSEFYEKGVVSPIFAEQCAAAALRFNPITFVVDSAAADVAEQLRMKDLNVVLAIKDVLPGIRRLQCDLAWDEDASPLLTMEPGLRDGNSEYPLYRWKEDKDEPVKEKDDAIDADRYARMYIHAGGGGGRALIMLSEMPRPPKPLRKLVQDHDAEHFTTHFTMDEDDDRLWDDFNLQEYLTRL